MLSCLRWIPSLKKLKIGQSRLNSRIPMCCAGSYIISSIFLAKFCPRTVFFRLYNICCRMQRTYLVVRHLLTRVRVHETEILRFSQGEFPESIVSCLSNSNNSDKTKHALLVRCCRSGYETPGGFGARRRAGAAPRSGRLQTRPGSGGGVPVKN